MTSPKHTVSARPSRTPGNARRLRCALFSLVVLYSITFVACGQSLPSRADEPGAEPLFADGPPPPHVACSNRDGLRQPFFGDTHVHTAYSFDASSQDARNTPFDAYRFAQGERLGLQPYDSNGEPLRTMQLGRPLDFVAVTDHAEPTNAAPSPLPLR